MAAVAGGVWCGQATPANKVFVDNPRELAAALARFDHRGGIVVLRGGFDNVRVSGHSRGTLTIRGGRVGRLTVLGSETVRIIGMRIGSRRLSASGLNVFYSRRVEVDRVVVAGNDSQQPRLRLRSSKAVFIRDSRFNRCGGTVQRRVCILLGASRGVRIVGNLFADCFACDFIGGRNARAVLIRGNTFGNALVDECGWERTCNHNDSIQLNGGRQITIEGNRFGIQEHGAAQVYLAGPIAGAVVRNNIFRGADPARPGFVTPVGIRVGNHVEPTGAPTNVVIAHNTILSGAYHNSGSDTSVSLSRLYVTLPGKQRPVIVNNVLGAVRTVDRLCAQAQRVAHNIIREGSACADTDMVGDPMVDDWGLPLEASPVVDRAEPGWASYDFNGAPRDDQPDVGAIEVPR